MHGRIKDFHRNGEIADSNIPQTKETLVKDLEEEMRDRGYVPVLDIHPQFTLLYKPDNEKYDFKLTVYGTYVGKDKAWQVSGMMAGMTIPKYTPRTRFTKSSTMQESK